MQHSEQINELAAALAKAQGSMAGAKKDAENPFFKSKYADLEAVWEACRAPLASNGLSIIQTVGADEQSVSVSTMLAHASGQWVSDVTRLIPKDGSPQAMGSCISYGRRYALAAMVGVYQTDDDAEAAHGRNDNGHQRAVNERTKATKSANEYSQRIINALNAGADLNAVDICREAKDISEEFMTDVWHCLSTPIRNRLRELQKAAA